MMENCKHLSRIRPAWTHSIVNPQKWLCYVCGTTESVWACLSCSNVACGRFNGEHALKHYQDSKHPICIEVNERYVYCYVCDDYVLNDNAAGDLKVLRSALSAIATQTFTDIESRGKRLLRSYSRTGIVLRSQAEADDKWATAIWHRRQYLLGKVLAAWQSYAKQEKKKKMKTPEKRSRDPLALTTLSPLIKKRTLIPGVTGLRNLGNTCYMNSILQILGHLETLRDFFLKLQFDASLNSADDQDEKNSFTPQSTPTSSLSHPAHSYTRQSTVDCLEHLQTSSSASASSRRGQGGLNGGSSSHNPSVKLICNVESKGKSKNGSSLCQELHGLFRVLWSGRWAQVSPHAFLRAVWTSIPVFKGYAQHDAQEFLCELLDKFQNELNHSVKTTLIKPESVSVPDIVDHSFQGELVSQVTCESCGNISKTFEPFMDLSLEFPSRYQITRTNSNVAIDMCHVTEMLAKFTETENLEGKIYSCEKCNSKRTSLFQTSTILTEAKKQLLVHKLPQYLRLHLKRFRWSGRLHREKICTHVAFNDTLDMQPFCYNSSRSNNCYDYKLLGVVIHHGKGFASGHYTAYTWNSEAESWVHCNDSRLQLSPLEDVLQSQAYILVYAHNDIENENALDSLVSMADITNDMDSSMPSTHDIFAESSCNSSPQVTNCDSSSLHQESSTSGETIAHQVDEEVSFIFQKPNIPPQFLGKRKPNTSEDDCSTKRRRSSFW